MDTVTDFIIMTIIIKNKPMVNIIHIKVNNNSQHLPKDTYTNILSDVSIEDSMNRGLPPPLQSSETLL